MFHMKHNERIYMNFSEIFLNNGTLSARLILWLLYFAIIIGTVFYYTVNNRLGKIVLKLIDLDATTPESALTVEDAGINYGFFTKMCLKSPMNYKDLLVAITSDGKFYANMHYSDTEPKLKTLKAITRKRKSRVGESEPEQTEVEEPIIIDAKAPEKITFNTYTAKYYIPKEVHDKVKGVFKPSKTNVFLIIGGLILLGVITYFAGFLVESTFNTLS